MMMNSTASSGILHVLNKPSRKLMANWYAEQVVNGNIIAGKEVILACERHLNDLEKSNSDDYPYTFDEELGHRVIRFIEKFCKPSKGDYQMLILQPWQHFALGSL